MNLQEFVKNVLINLDKAVDEARQEMQRDIHFSTTNDQRTIEFDIAVSVEETDSKSGKAGIKVLQFVEGGGTLSKENRNSTVSRVKFGINISSRTKQENERHESEVRALNEENRNRWEI